VQRGSLYNAYGDKEAIFLRAFDRYAEAFLASANTSLQGNNAAALLGSFFRSVITSMTTGSPPRGCLTTKTTGDGSLASDRIRQRLRGLLDGLVATVEAALSRPEVQPQLSLPPDQAAQLVVTFTRGLAVMERVYADPDTLLRSADGLVQLLVKGHAGHTGAGDGQG
jgi:TetR/AcrR family transcriptional regulator, transcriptional repressor for nem operon